jgi:hypothetical protein
MSMEFVIALSLLAVGILLERKPFVRAPAWVRVLRRR